MTVATPDMVMYCFDVLSAHLEHLEVEPFSLSMEKYGTFRCPLFVTWKKDERLRGCIGTLSPTHVLSQLKTYVVQSAFNDSRFDPITRDEIPQLHCTVSLLVDYERITDRQDWEVGTHGLMIQFHSSDKVKAYQATYLPEVAKEQQWKKDEAIYSLIRKSGYSRNRHCHDLSSLPIEFVNQISITRYRTSKFSMTWTEYAQARETSKLWIKP